MTRTKSVYLALLAVLLSPMAANADPITYDVNQTIGTGSVVGTIQTDGTLGVLGSSNIVSWILTLSSPNLSGGSPQVLTDANSSVRMSGSGVIASLADLIFDWSGGPDWSLLFSGGSPFSYWCMTTGPITCNSEATPSEVIGYGTDGDNAEERLRTGPGVIARASSVPEPGTLALLGIGLAGLGLTRRRRKV